MRRVSRGISGDIVGCQRVDCAGDPQGHPVSLVDSAAPNGGFDVKRWLDFRLRDVDTQVSCTSTRLTWRYLVRDGTSCALSR